MPPLKIQTFDEAIADSDSREGGRSVLLGNGFSIDWDHKIFAYDSLYSEANLSNLSTEKEGLFDSIGTHDFEEVVNSLRTFAKTGRLYGISEKITRAMIKDAVVVRRGLADVLTLRHPHDSTALSDDQVTQARQFLSNFGRTYTLNYDLLLYWVLNRNVVSQQGTVQSGDGFEWPSYEGARDELIWKRSAADRGQRVFYLHGALHLFVQDRRLHKLKYSKSPLLEQVRDKIDSGSYPLLVTEGSNEEKAERIERSAYLRYCFDSFERLTGSLFVHGVSLSANDSHLTRCIESKQSKIEAMYVSIFGDPDEESNEELVTRAKKVVRNRQKNGGGKLHLAFYDSSSVHLWRQ